MTLIISRVRTSAKKVPTKPNIGREGVIKSIKLMGVDKLSLISSEIHSRVPKPIY